MSELPHSRSSEGRSLYRCAECGNGDHLSCWSIGLFEGPMGSDGSLLRYDWEEDTEVQESSIKCAIHGDCVPIHKLIGGVYHRWERCESCEGKGDWRGYLGRRQSCSKCRGRGGAEVPIEEVVHA